MPSRMDMFRDATNLEEELKEEFSDKISGDVGGFNGLLQNGKFEVTTSNENITNTVTEAVTQVALEITEDLLGLVNADILSSTVLPPITINPDMIDTQSVDFEPERLVTIIVPVTIAIIFLILAMLCCCIQKQYKNRRNHLLYVKTMDSISPWKQKQSTEIPA